MAQDDIRAADRRDRDFLGAFAVVERGGRILMVENARHIGGRDVTTWDLPGGQIEAGELLGEALRRELDEETGLLLSGRPRLLFVQEGERTTGGRRSYAWRSFFFGCEAKGEPAARGEVLAVRWVARADLPALLTAPYHDSFERWLAGALDDRLHGSAWRD